MKPILSKKVIILLLIFLIGKYKVVKKNKQSGKIYINKLMGIDNN